jgi:hypothetical protein
MWKMSEVDPVTKFWRWFTKHEKRLWNFEEDQERIFDELATELQKVDQNLTFEFGPQKTKREFVISAAGIKSAFPAVVSLAKAAPALERWQITAFRPRRTTLSIIEFRNKQVDPAAVQFSMLSNGERLGLYLFIPGFCDDDADYGQIGYLMLDEALGEYDVETGLGLIKMMPLDTLTDYERHPLAELPSLFDQLTSQLQSKSGRPS